MKRLLVLAFAALGACNHETTGLGPPSDPATETFDPSLGISIGDMTKLEGGVYIEDLVVGTGDSISVRTDTAWVTYTGFLKNAEEFDDGVNTRFILTEVIPGFRIGLLGMRAGGRRIIVVPSELGYGERAVYEPGTVDPRIPRQSTLIFRVELLRFHTPPEEEDDDDS